MGLSQFKPKFVPLKARLLLFTCIYTITQVCELIFLDAWFQQGYLGITVAVQAAFNLNKSERSFKTKGEQSFKHPTDCRIIGAESIKVQKDLYKFLSNFHKIFLKQKPRKD